ncbi:MAG TPA: prolyl oligopeptidase family serine peptidase [Verrucomicrobiae bacterium]|nr:prolyl oligopeptidase family serine peptidase [Verrucomicrobiae bacterium]
MKTNWLVGLFFFLCGPGVRADGLADNWPEKVRPVPPPGIAISETDRAELRAGVAELGKEIDSLRAELNSKPAMLELLPDVQIFHNAVRYALNYDEFYKTNQTQVARDFLRQAHERAQLLRAGNASWGTATGLVVRGYVSKIDGSVQPYGLVVPPTFQAGSGRAHRLDLWFHGRGETLTELDFINGRQKSPGEFTPPDAFVLHLYGRYCNGNKFAGEVDVFEALDSVRKHYPIDDNRLVVRGFSLGGAACWHMAVHHAGLWAAAAPGAGFSETPDFLKVFQKETLAPTWYEQKLWHLYDCTDYAVNLFNCPTVAYSGEIDSQKQAADIMGKALALEGIEMVHIIGPKTAHSYHPDSKKEINRRIESIAARGRNPVPDHVRFTTWTLRYNQMNWVTVDGLEQHWERARVDAVLDDDDNSVKVTTKNVAAMTLDFAPGLCPLDNTRPPKVEIDGHKMIAPRVLSDRSWTVHFHKSGKRWEAGDWPEKGALRKQHGLQGPIDDAFMDSFIMVRPTGKPMTDKIGAWTSAEMAHAIEQWKLQFRGEPRVKDDTEITDADLASSNLVLWGDPASNQLLARVTDKLPIKWSAAELRVGSRTYAIDHHVPVLIHPNPLNPKRYIVLNSGFTFREYDQLNNARQVPKLPDFAIVDVNVPVSSRAPGGIADAGFFGEDWELTKETK